MYIYIYIFKKKKNLRQMSERFERTGLFIVCWGKNRDTKEASEREPGARLGLFSSSVRASVAYAQLLFACNLVAQVTHWEGWVDGRTERSRTRGSVWDVEEIF